MSVEFRLPEPIKVLYTEYHPRKSENELDEVQLKVQEVKTLGEAFSLERDILTSWAQRVQDGGYIAIPWPVDLGSPSQQVFVRLLAEHGLVDMVTSHEDPVMPKEEREKIDLPPVISSHWLSFWLGQVLGLPYEVPKPDWFDLNIRYVFDHVRALTGSHGQSSKKDYLAHFAATVKMRYDAMPEGAVEAVGCQQSGDPANPESLDVYFKMKKVEQA